MTKTDLKLLENEMLHCSTEACHISTYSPYLDRWGTHYAFRHNKDDDNLYQIPKKDCSRRSKWPKDMAGLLDWLHRLHKGADG